MDIESGQRKLNFAINTLNEISWGAKNKAKPVDYDGFNERVRISLAGTIYEVKRGVLVQIGWNRLSCVFKKRWEKFLLCDKNGRVYFDYESEWMKPILQALKGEVDIVLDKSSNNVSAWNVILSRFQLQDNIKFNVGKESNDEKDLKPVKRMVTSYPYSTYYSSTATNEEKKVDVKAVTVTRTPLPQPTRFAPSSIRPNSGFGNTFFQSNEILKVQLSLLNQSGPLLFEMEEVLAKVKANLLTFLQELTFMGDFLYSEWKDIIPSFTKKKDGITDVTEPEESIEKHLQYFSTIFPIIQDYKHRVRAASSDTERRRLDGLAYFNVEGEKMVIKKSSLLSVFGESQLAVRLSGRWTEQADDVDEEGNIYYDVAPSAFRALLQYVRFRSFHLTGPLTFSRMIQIPLQGLVDYFSINKSSVSILYEDK